MPPSPTSEILIRVETADGRLAASAVAQFLSGVAIMREAIALSVTGDRRQFSSRLSSMRSPFLPMPAEIVEACGYAWNIIGDWPPMDPVHRGALTQGVLEACAPADSPEVLSIRPKCLEIVLRDIAGAIADKFREGVEATKSLMGRSDRPAFKDKMMAILESESTPATGGGLPSSVATLMANPLALLGRGPGMLAAGTVMFGCQRIESSYGGLHAVAIETITQPAEKPTVAQKKASRKK